MSPNSGVWKGSESEIQRRRESCLWSVCDMNIRRALQPQGNRLSDAHIIPLCGPSLIPVSSTFFTVIPLCLLSSVRAEKEEMHSTHRWLFLSENQINKKRFLWWGCIVVNIMLIWKCLLDYIRGILPAYPNVIVCLTGGSKSEFRKSQIWISRTTNGKKQWWEMNRRGSLFPSPATCGQGISPPTASAEQSIGQDKTAGLLWVPQRDYVQPSCSLQLFLQNAAVHHNVFWLSSSNTVFGEWVRPNIKLLAFGKTPRHPVIKKTLTLCFYS